MTGGGAARGLNTGYVFERDLGCKKINILGEDYKGIYFFFKKVRRHLLNLKFIRVSA